LAPHHGTPVGNHCLRLIRVGINSLILFVHQKRL
jgi:hypothetical protein